MVEVIILAPHLWAPQGVMPSYAPLTTTPGGCKARWMFADNLRGHFLLRLEALAGEASSGHAAGCGHPAVNPSLL